MMNKKRISPMLLIFILSIAIAITAYTVSQFNIGKQVEVNTVKIDDSILREQQTKIITQQTKNITYRQSQIMNLIINRTGSDIDLDHAIMQKLNAINNKADTALKLGNNINDKLNILLGNNTK